MLNFQLFRNPNNEGTNLVIAFQNGGQKKEVSFYLSDKNGDLNSKQIKILVSYIKDAFDALKQWFPEFQEDKELTKLRKEIYKDKFIDLY